MRLGPALLAVVALACSPRLADGRFGCPDGVCPAGYRCDPDRFCRTGGPPPPVDAGSDAGMPPPDGGGTTRTFGPCTSDAQCAAPERCFRGPDGEWADVGYCTRSCTTAGEPTGCPPRPMSATLSTCEESSSGLACQLTCGGIDPACAPGFACAAFFRSPDGSGGFFDGGDCVPAGQAIEEVAPTPCTADAECLPGTCATLGPRRVCARPCGDVYSCPDGVACVSSSDRGQVCQPPPP